MISEVVLGIDIGTSYLKSAILDSKGQLIACENKNSPQFNKDKSCDANYACNLWLTLYEFIIDVVSSCIANNQKPIVAAIISISPVLILFEYGNPNKTLAIPYWHIPTIDGISTGCERTKRRIRALSLKAIDLNLKEPIICDLIGYLNFRLTGELSINSITAGELGFEDMADIQSLLIYNYKAPKQIQLLSPSQLCGTTSIKVNKTLIEIKICAGASDSFGTIIYSGGVKSASEMIYLGTFGSFLEVLENIEPLLTIKNPSPCLPYRWLISVPDFGPMVEHYAQEMFPSNQIQTSLKRLDCEAASTIPGAGGVFLSLQHWDNIGTKVGEFKFNGWETNKIIPTSLYSRAILESLAYLILAYGVDNKNRTEYIYLAGGGTTSQIWLQILSDTLECPLRTIKRSNGAFAATYIASTLLNWDAGKKWFSGNIHTVYPNLKQQNTSVNTLRYAIHWYKSHGYFSQK